MERELPHSKVLKIKLLALVWNLYVLRHIEPMNARHDHEHKSHHLLCQNKPKNKTCVLTLYKCVKVTLNLSLSKCYIAMPSDSLFTLVGIIIYVTSFCMHVHGSFLSGACELVSFGGDVQCCFINNILLTNALH